ncbi:MAG: DUF3536 domain-containing protein [Acidimicrobiales bacterium]|nr:DUF3536 domain-containing protein [Acidimicrobiales bacterium]
MTPPRHTGPYLAVHGHFYQPPRENPWTETVPVEPSASPWHDWNERITDECYRPNAFARIVDDHGRLVSIVNNYQHLSFDVGPTLLRWLEARQPEVYQRIIEADRGARGAMAQAYHHSILPLASRRDRRTEVRWGLADFEHRFGRRATGLWLPETAVNADVLAVLAEEGVRFTILAPNQALRVRPLGGADDQWEDVGNGTIDTRRPYRWLHPDGDGLGVDIVFYDGGLSHDVAFGLAARSSQDLIERMASSAGAGQVVTVATDGETFGHHHRFTERAIAYALAVEAPRRHLAAGALPPYLSRHRPNLEVEVRESAWSCAHGVGRWKEDCGCHTGGGPGWTQRWRAPLRAALDVLRDAADEVFERRGAEALERPWEARDDYVKVLLGAVTVDRFAARHVIGGHDGPHVVTALTLLEAQRHALAMYTSCGWFFHDLAGIETVQVLRYAARLVDLLEELDEEPPLADFLALLEQARSNDPLEGTGVDIWARRVEPSRVTAERVVAHLALLSLLEHRDPEPVLASYDVVLDGQDHDSRGAVEMCSGEVTLVHRRTRRRTAYVYAALHLGGLEIVGAARPARPEVDREARAGLRDAFVSGERVSTLVRAVVEGFGPHEFGLESVLPDAGGQILESTARKLTERFAQAYEQLFGDHRPIFAALGTAGYELPPELRAPAELALSRRFAAEVARQERVWDPDAYQAALFTADEARLVNLHLATPEVLRTLERAVRAAVRRAVSSSDDVAAHSALALLRLAGSVGASLDLAKAQEDVYAALLERPSAALQRLGGGLGLAVERLGEVE